MTLSEPLRRQPAAMRGPLRHKVEVVDYHGKEHPSTQRSQAICNSEGLPKSSRPTTKLLSSTRLADGSTMAKINSHLLLTTDTVAVWDVLCSGTCRHKS